MPGPLVAAKAGDRLGADIDQAHGLVLLAILAAAALVIFAAVRTSPGGPKTPAAVTEDIPDYEFQPPPGAPVIGVDEHTGGYVFTPHRYPRMCGGELSAVINGGHATLRLPHQKDMTWLVRPPSEAAL